MNVVKPLVLLFVAVGAGLALAGCEPSDPDSPRVAEVASIAATPSPLRLDVGVVQPLAVTATYTDGSTHEVGFNSTFASSATAVAAVNAQGVVTAVAPGSATITAKHTPSGQTATVTVTVSPLRVVSIQVAPAALTLAPGARQALTVTGRYNDATTGNVTAGSTFSTSDAAVATVSAAGIVTAEAVGSATITVTHTASRSTATASVSVRPATPLLFSTNYAQVDPRNWKSAEGGDAGTYVDTSVPTQYWWNGVAPTAIPPNFYFGYGLNVNSKPWGFGAFVKAPGNGTASVSGYSHLQIAVWGNDQLMARNPTLTLILRGPSAGNCTPELKGEVKVPGVGVQTYTVPLAGFTVQTPCPGIATPAQALAAGVNEVHVQVLGANVQYVADGDPAGNYPNGLNVGPISFVAGIYASNFSQVDGKNWKTAEGGDVSTYVDTSVPTQYWWNGVAPTGNPPSYYFGYGLNVNSKPWGFGTFVKAPGNGTFSVAGYSHLQIAIWGNPELMGTNPTLTLILRGPAAGNCTPELKGTVKVPGAGVQTYTVPLAGFAVQTPCPGIATLEQALAAGVNEVHVQVLGANVQYVAGGDPAGNYPNGLNVGPISFVAGIYASNYAQLDERNWRSVEGGDAGTYVDTSVPTQYWWNGVAPAAIPPSFYFGYGLNVNSKPWGFGAFVKAPGNGTYSVAGYSQLQITIWGNDQLMRAGPTLTLILRGPTAGGCTPELKGEVKVPGVGVQTYTVPLAGFTVKTPCPGIATPAQALAAGVNEVHVQVLGANVQYVADGDPAGNFPNGLNIGPIGYR